MPVKFKCTLKNGEVIIGLIMGNGGFLGAACSHLSKARQRDSAARILALARVFLKNHGKQRRIYEPKQGCCAVYPDECAATDGDPIAVPLVGTEFEVLED